MLIVWLFRNTSFLGKPIFSGKQQVWSLLLGHSLRSEKDGIWAMGVYFNKLDQVRPKKVVILFRETIVPRGLDSFPKVRQVDSLRAGEIPALFDMLLGFKSRMGVAQNFARFNHTQVSFVFSLDCRLGSIPDRDGFVVCNPSCPTTDCGLSEIRIHL